MAIDSREKRQNAAGVARPYMRHPFPVGATDEQSRIARGHGYGGNALSASGAVLASQLRASFRATFGRVFGRVN